MKISKFNHGRTAVGVIEEHNPTNAKIGGFTYTYPGQKINLNKRIGEKKYSWSFLYNIFSPVSAGNLPKKPSRESYNSEELYNRRMDDYYVKKANYDRRSKCVEEKIISRLNTTLKNCFFDKETKRMKDNSVIISSLSDKRIELCGLTAEEVVSLALRKSLRDQQAGAIAVIESAGRDGIDNNSRKLIDSFLNAVRKDYSRFDVNSEFTKKTIKSISNQNLIVQPINVTESTLLALPVPSQQGKKTQYKKGEKAALNEFLLMYASLDEGIRMSYLRKLRRLVEVFFAPSLTEASCDDDLDIGEMIDTTDFDVWQKHEKGKQRKGSFVVIPEELSNAWNNKKRLDSVKEKKLTEELLNSIRMQNAECYRYAIRVVNDNALSEYFFDNPDINAFWVHHIENAVERILKQRLKGNLYKLDIAYLCEKVWKDIINYISIKYIAAGKAVYHFMLNESVLPSGEKFITFDRELPDTINSFDYEMIKAKETLQRELAVFISFAARNFASNTVKLENLKSQKADVLLWKEEDFNVFKNYNDSKSEMRSVLSFLGGASSWDMTIFEKAYPNSKFGYDVSFLNDINKCIYSLRNESFHFVTFKDDTGNWNTDLFGKMFEYEADRCVDIIRKRVYSNNLPMFYQERSIQNVLDKLYSHPVTRASQVPAFNRVITRKNARSFLKSIGAELKCEDGHTIEKWESACYYILKEAYYNDFLQSPKVMRLFSEAINGLEEDSSNNINAVKNFKEICSKLQNGSLSELCQIIMTEYDLQNNKNRKVESSADNTLFDKKIFKHYKLLLEKTLMIAFSKYVAADAAYDFIKKPYVQEMPTESAFLSTWSTSVFGDLTDKVRTTPELQKWYVSCRFMNGRSLNQMVGSMRSYIQFVDNIAERAKVTGNTLHKDESENVCRIKNAIPVVEMCIQLADRYTNEITDYFNDEEDYARHLSKYVDYESDTVQGLSLFEKLKAFSLEGDESQGIFTDHKNPIVNRNVVLSKLFGADLILGNTVKRITKEDISDLQTKREAIESYLISGCCKDHREQEAVLYYQRLKNRVELRDVAEYSELINELLGQLVNWSYLRERDLLYFQLGFHYMSLNNNTAKPDAYKTISYNELDIKNAILRQIAGLYINGIGILCPSEDGSRYTEEKRDGGAGDKIRCFANKYSMQSMENDDPYSLYNSGLEVFEVLGEHDNVTKLRNYIDHFKYYTDVKKSIIDLYSEVFDRFFTYDMKYHKSVPLLLQNILLRHAVNIEPVFETGEKNIGVKEEAVERKKSARIKIGRILSERFTYKIPAEHKNLVIDARDADYMKTVLNILYYPEKPDIEPTVNKSDVKEDKTKSKNSISGKKPMDRGQYHRKQDTKFRNREGFEYKYNKHN